MKPLLLLFCLCFTATGFAQQQNPQTITGTVNKTADSVFRSKPILFKSRPDTGIDKNILPYNSMPNAVRRKNPPDVYEGNNGQGQDIYRSQLDNMAILKPDSTFQQAMPNAVKKYELHIKPAPDPRITPRVWIQPKKDSKSPYRK